MFWRKCKSNQEDKVEAWQREVREKVERDRHAARAVSTPLGDICADIVAHPEEYGFFKVDPRYKWAEKSYALKNRTDRDIFIQKDCGIYGCIVTAPWGEDGIGNLSLVDEAFEAHAKHRLALDRAAAEVKLKSTIDSLAAVKAARNINEAKPAQGDHGCDEPDAITSYDEAFSDLVDLSGSWLDGLPLKPTTVRRIAKLAERMLPVLDGTQRIVPVDTIKGPTWTIEAPVERTVTAYMCAIDWDHEIGHAVVELHPGATLSDHSAECGIVEVEVRLKRVIRAQALGDNAPATRDFLTDPGRITPKPKKRKKKARAA